MDGTSCSFKRQYCSLTQFLGDPVCALLGDLLVDLLQVLSVDLLDLLLHILASTELQGPGVASHCVSLHFTFTTEGNWVLLHNVDAHNVNVTGRVCYLTLFYTRGLGIVVLHVMVPEPYRFPLCFFQ
jgi:hypothetical protein